MPNTSTLLALRAAGERGTFAHAWANGAAASFAELALPATLVVAVAVAATRSTAAAAPTRSQRRLCFDALAGVPSPFLRRRGGSLVSRRLACHPLGSDGEVPAEPDHARGREDPAR